MEVVYSLLWPTLTPKCAVDQSHVLPVPTEQGASVYHEASSPEEESGLINTCPQSNCRSPQCTVAYCVKVFIGTVCLYVCVWRDQFTTGRRDHDTTGYFLLSSSSQGTEASMYVHASVPTWMERNKAFWRPYLGWLCLAGMFTNVM